MARGVGLVKLNLYCVNVDSEESDFFKRSLLLITAQDISESLLVKHFGECVNEQ